MEIQKTSSLKVKFWGVRGSYPVPGNNTITFGGNTACVEVSIGNRKIIFDAGTGIIGLGRQLLAESSKNLNVMILFSHLHHDHTQGFPFFAPAYLPGSIIHLFGPGTSENTLSEILQYNQTPPKFPITLQDMAAKKDIRSLREQDVIVLKQNNDHITIINSSNELNGDPDQISIRILKSYAHPGGVYVYRLEWQQRSIVYATDVEGYVGGDRRLAKFASGADLLIHDAQYNSDHYWGLLEGFESTQGYGHSTAQIACETARLANVHQLVLFHHDPAYNDNMIKEIQEKYKLDFPNVTAAFEGLEFCLSPIGSASQPEVMEVIGDGQHDFEFSNHANIGSS